LKPDEQVFYLSATFISDQPVIDSPFIYSGIIGAGGYLFLRDGTRYRIDRGFITWMTDRNGNKVSFEYNGSEVTSIKDSLNRQVTIAYNVDDGAPYGICDRITYKGFGGTTRIIRISYKDLHDILRPGFSVQTLHALFPQLNNSSYTDVDGTLPAVVWLPASLHRQVLRLRPMAVTATEVSAVLISIKERR
jgi:hypothetical protein